MSQTTNNGTQVLLSSERDFWVNKDADYDSFLAPKHSKIIILVFVVSAVAALLKGCAPETNNVITTAQKSPYKSKWGIKVESIRLSSAGYMLDFRYRILDPQKAAPLLSRQVKPYLVDQESGSKLIVPAPPKVGSLRQKSYQPIPGKIYFVLFSNPGRLVKPGNKVTVVIGDFRAEDLIVE